MKTSFPVKRAYDPAARSDGTRILVDRLWPRGVSKARARIGLWLKEAAPSSALRKWFHDDPEERWPEFASRYRKELAKNRKAIRASLAPVKGKATLVTAVKDIEHSHIPVLSRFLGSSRTRR
ncbi:MAG: DUF488 family protein [Patescibacteria group bacterium]|nr:DUF488 family protein [Patescibacteria group bacterium]